MLRVTFNRMVAMARFSKAKQVAAEDRIKELFGESEVVGGEVYLAVNKLRAKKIQQEVEYNQKVKNYHQYQYFRGEDFIENIPYAEHAKYTIKDKISEQRQKQRISVQELQPRINHAERARIIRDRINAYHDKQRKYEIEQFERYLSQYPGTVRGPKPEDDWQAYRDYALKKMPRILTDQLNQELAAENYRKSFRDQTVEQQEVEESNKISSPISLLSTFGKDRFVIDKSSSKEEIAAFNDVFQEGRYMHQVIEDTKSDVPLMPTVNFENYQYFIRHWMDWLHFRKSYVEHNQDQNLKILQKKMEKLCDVFLQHDGNEWVDLPSNIPSLYRYYKCLPKQLQDHPGMKDIYLGLQYSSPDFPYEEKEDALNYTCPFLLPFDDITTKVMTDYTACSRVKPPIYIYEKVFTIGPEFTWDITTFLDQIRKQELRGQASNQNKEARYPQPPEVHKMWEEGAPNLPVDFYDNEDGFWDSIISEKLKRYDQCKPMLKTRQHFTH